MRTEVTLVSHKTHSQQSVLQLLRLLAQHQVCCRQLSMLTHAKRPYLAVVVSVSGEENAWLAQLIRGGLDATLASIEQAN